MSASGFDGSLNIIDETTYAVGKAPTRAYEVLKEGLKFEQPRIKSKALRAGRRTTHRWALGAIKAGGTFETELAPQGFALLFKHLLGTVNTTGAGPYVHTFSPGPIDGKSFTTQVQRPQLDGTLIPFNYVGCKLIDAELSAKVGDYCMAKWNVFAANEYRYRQVTDAVSSNGSAVFTSATAAFTQADVGAPIASTGFAAADTYIKSVQSATSATASVAATTTGTTLSIGLASVSPTYNANLAPVVFTGAYLAGAGVEYPVDEFSLKITTGIEAPRTKMRQFLAAISREPKENVKRVITGKMKGDFEGTTLHDRFVQGLETSLVLNFVSGLHSIVITMNVEYSEDVETIDGDKILDESVGFEALGGANDAAAITVVITNGDTTP